MMLSLKGKTAGHSKERDRIYKCSHSYWRVFADSQKVTIRGKVRECFKDSFWFWIMQEGGEKSMGVWEYGSMGVKISNTNPELTTLSFVFIKIN
jgi:hypothetical protein